jgi:hypothetical protein
MLVDALENNYLSPVFVCIPFGRLARYYGTRFSSAYDKRVITLVEPTFIAILLLVFKKKGVLLITTCHSRRNSDVLTYSPTSRRPEQGWLPLAEGGRYQAIIASGGPCSRLSSKGMV